MNKLTLKRSMIILIMTLCAIAVLHGVLTQYFAHKLQYQDVFLGKPLTKKLYLPWKVHTWSQKYKGGHIDELIDKCTYALIVGSLLAFGASCVVILQKPMHRTTHGTARFATEDEVSDWGWTKTPMQRARALRRAKKPTREADSITFAKNKAGKLLYDWGAAHVLFAAMTRGGKGISAVIPTCLSWRGSIVVLDLKGENYAITGKWRSKFSHLIYFNPTKRSSARFNPLLEVRRAYLIRDVMNIVEILSERAKSEQNIFWDSGSKRLLVAVIIYVLHTQKIKSLGTVADLILDVDMLLEYMALTDFGERYLNTFIHGTVSSFQSKDEKIRGGWAAGAEVILDLWKDPIVRDVTSTSDFRLQDFQRSQFPLSLYFVIPPGDIDRLSVFVRLFITQLTDALTEELDESVLGTVTQKIKQNINVKKDDDDWYDSFIEEQNQVHEKKQQRARKQSKKLKKQEHFHRLLMLCDEFPQFKRMAKVERAVSYTAGYGIKWFFITQGFNQLNAEYGVNNAIVPNCHIHLGLRCADTANAKIWEERLGIMTAVKTQRTRSTQSGGKGGRKVTTTVSEQEFARPLMYADELMKLDENRLIVVQSGKDPYLAYRTSYYNDKRFKKKFEGQLLAWPRERLDDFPSKVVRHDWGTDYIEIQPMVEFDALVEEKGLELNAELAGQPREHYTKQEKQQLPPQTPEVVEPPATNPGAVEDLLNDMFGFDVDEPEEVPVEASQEQEIGAATSALSEEELESFKQIDAMLASQGGRRDG